MKKNEFVKMINNLKNFYDAQAEYGDNLAKVFGSDTVIYCSLTEKYIDETLKLIGELVGDVDSVDWLFWESMASPTGELMTFEVDGVEYDGTPENLWEQFLKEKK